MLKEAIMEEIKDLTRGERILKSESARERRSMVKAIRSKVEEQYYAMLHRQKKKMKKIKERHHDKRIN